MTTRRALLAAAALALVPWQGRAADAAALEAAIREAIGDAVPIDGGIELAHEVLVDANGADFGDLQPGLGGPLAVLEAVAFEHAHGGARTIDIAPGLCRDAGHTIAFLATQFDQQGKR